MKWWRIAWLGVVGMYGLIFGGYVVLRILDQPWLLSDWQDMLVFMAAYFTLPAFGLYVVLAVCAKAAGAVMRRAASSA